MNRLGRFPGNLRLSQKQGNQRAVFFTSRALLLSSSLYYYVSRYHRRISRDGSEDHSHPYLVRMLEIQNLSNSTGKNSSFCSSAEVSNMKILTYIYDKSLGVSRNTAKSSKVRKIPCFDLGSRPYLLPF